MKRTKRFLLIVFSSVVLCSLVIAVNLKAEELGKTGEKKIENILNDNGADDSKSLASSPELRRLSFFQNFFGPLPKDSDDGTLQNILQASVEDSAATDCGGKEFLVTVVITRRDFQKEVRGDALYVRASGLSRFICRQNEKVDALSFWPPLREDLPRQQRPLHFKAEAIDEAFFAQGSGEVLFNFTHDTGCGSRDFFVLRALKYVKTEQNRDGTGVFRFVYHTNNECESATTSTIQYSVADIRWLLEPMGLQLKTYPFPSLEVKGSESCHYSLDLGLMASGGGEDFCKAIRRRYDGTWRGSMGGEIAAEVLKDGSVLVEVSGRLAEYFFYHFASAHEEIVCDPSEDGARNLNYFSRTSNSIACGFWSQDLKRDPFPAFKCRFSINGSGELHAFSDRSAVTSNAKPQFGEWEDAWRDFYWRGLDAIVSKTASAYQDLDPNSERGGQFNFQFYGPVAREVFDRLTVDIVKSSWGPDIRVNKKTGRDLWCLQSSQPDNFSSDPDQMFKCRITFDSSGNPIYGK